MDDLNALIGADSNADVAQITAGDHENSYIWRKMDGSQALVGGGGARMPSGGPEVSQEDLEAFAAWIDSLDD